ncbi:restriction endonuclease subunit S [Pseudomonas oleovorans]|uniref:Restriction endonuclease subunit S n=1 Tax=Ectopseudomonas oleovorans TaxID=301 RepID=A0AB35L2R1_ECTOL|nr:restriction endonuclease subunit S [Pseudomonas oleovorans]MCR1826300.1 restriction endonuclease subunit S [Pseudomonas oleovorans]MDH0568957.1 restriction endonuclease subunit S [Pseudomonas oleovorans]
MSWPVIKFSEAISRSGLFSDGDWVESKDQDPEGDVRLIQLADIGVGEFIDKSNRFMTSKRADELRCSYLKAGDILVARMPDPIGRACIFPEDMGRCVTVVDICIVRPDSERIDNRWLMHLINSERFRNQIDRHVTGTTRQRISRGNLAGLEIPLPPLPEQKRIAAILDKADAIRRKRQQAIQLADDFLRAVFLDMFGDPVTNPKGWPSVKLGEVCGVGSSKRVFVDEFTDAGVPFYRGTEVGALGEGQKIQAELFISQEHYDDLVSHSGAPEVGDLLLPSICHDGRIWKVNHKEQFYFKDGRVLWVKVNRELIDGDYLRSYLQRMFLSNYSAIASGTTFAELKIVNLKSMNILSPPLALQRKFSELVKAISESGKLYATADLEGEDLFSSLAKQAFSGQL